MGHGGRRRRVRVRDELRWFEILMCCCKCRKECKECCSRFCLYGLPITYMIAVTAACIVFGIIWRNDCDYRKNLPLWLIASVAPPYLLLTFIKAVKEQYIGITFWRLVYFLCYAIFVASHAIGCYLVYHTWANGRSDCKTFLIWFAFGYTFHYWILFIIATVMLIYILKNVCCCCMQNAIKPLKPHFIEEDYM